jgi:hypothetical protein
MSKNPLRAAFAAVVAFAALIAGASMADATEATWIYARCTTGSLASAGNGGQDNAVVFGSAAFCGLAVLNSQFGVAVFEAGQTATSVLSYNLRTYLPGNKKRGFGMQVAKGKSGTFGVCLVGSPTMKVACGKVIFDHNSGYVEFTTIEPTDSLVNAKITGAEVAVDPRCGACF